MLGFIKEHVGGLLLLVVAILMDFLFYFVRFPIEPSLAFNLAILFAYLAVACFSKSKFMAKTAVNNLTAARFFIISFLFFGALLAITPSVFYYNYFMSNALSEGAYAVNSVASNSFLVSSVGPNTSAVSNIIQTLDSSLIVLSSILIGLVGIYLQIMDAKKKQTVEGAILFRELKVGLPGLIFGFQFMAIFMLIASIEFLVVGYSSALAFTDVAMLLEFTSFGSIGVLFFYFDDSARPRTPEHRSLASKLAGGKKSEENRQTSTTPALITGVNKYSGIILVILTLVVVYLTIQQGVVIQQQTKLVNQSAQLLTQTVRQGEPDMIPLGYCEYDWYQFSGYNQTYQIINIGKSPGNVTISYNTTNMSLILLQNKTAGRVSYTNNSVIRIVPGVSSSLYIQGGVYISPGNFVRSKYTIKIKTNGGTFGNDFNTCYILTCAYKSYAPVNLSMSNTIPNVPYFNVKVASLGSNDMQNGFNYSDNTTWKTLPLTSC